MSRFALELSGSVIQPLVVGQIPLEKFTDALASVSNKTLCLIVVVLFGRFEDETKTERHLLIDFVLSRSR